MFRRIPGFSRCVCLDRVPSPGPEASVDMDFLLLEPPPGAKVGLVEVEGWNTSSDAPMKVPKRADQVARSLHEFRAYRGRGPDLRRLCIDRCFRGAAQRKLVNVHAWGSYSRWTMALIGAKTRRALYDYPISQAAVSCPSCCTPLCTTARRGRPCAPRLYAHFRDAGPRPENPGVSGSIPPLPTIVSR